MLVIAPAFLIAAQVNSVHALETSSNTAVEAQHTTPPPEEELTDLDKSIAELDKEIAEIEASMAEAINDDSAEKEATKTAKPEKPTVEQAKITVKEELAVIKPLTEQASAKAVAQQPVKADKIEEQTKSQEIQEPQAISTVSAKSADANKTFSFTPIPVGDGSTQIPIIKNAKVFAKLVDKMPAVVNYFTPATEQELISFYQQALGEVIVQERKRGRLTLAFISDLYATRVIISEQNNARQVDIIQEENK